MGIILLLNLLLEALRDIASLYLCFSSIKTDFNNLEYVKKHLISDATFSNIKKLMLADAQTSGGLLISVARDKVDALQNSLIINKCLSSSIIGRIDNPDEKFIIIN